MKIIDEVLDEINNINLKSHEELKKYCEEDKHIKEIVEILFSKNSTNAQNHLIQFIYKCGYIVQRNIFHGNNVLSELCSFIGNYFYDDATAYFKITQKSKFNYWEICFDYGDYMIPKELLSKAKENAKIDEIIFNKRKLINI